MPTTTSAPIVSINPTPPQLVLMDYQRQTHDFLASRPFAGAWLGIGAGKTVSVLSVLQTLRPMGHILVIAPVAIARSTWIDQIEHWGFPIRTKSLIVDENDRKLTKDARLERFKQVFHDPPTMYFINQELLTQPAQATNMLHAEPDALTNPALAGLSPAAAFMLQLLISAGPAKADDLKAACSATMQPTPAKTHVTRALTELTKAKLVTRHKHPCSNCHAEGCHLCRFGLVDQMPIQKVNGHDSILWPFSTVIIDESQAFKSHDSERFKALASVRPAITGLIELTGTPAPNGLHDLWSQVYLLDQGVALGATITEFRERWFTPWVAPGTYVPAKWLPRPGAEQEIYQRIGHLVMSAQNTNLNLPGGEPTIIDQHITLPHDIHEAYKDFKKNLVLEVIDTHLVAMAQKLFDDWLAGPTTSAVDLRADLAALPSHEYDAAYDTQLQVYLAKNKRALTTAVVVENKAVLVSKLLQFASGTLYTSDPDDPLTKGRYEVIHTEKMQVVEYLVRNNNSEPMLLAYHFKSDLAELLKHLRAAKIDAQAFDGSRDMIRRWNAGKIQVMLIHPASAGHGLNLQHGGCSMIWYTLPFSLEHYMQTNGRLFRTGQTKPVTIYRLLTKGTHDERLPEILERKKAIQDNLLAAVAAPDVDLAALQAEILDDLAQIWGEERF